MITEESVKVLHIIDHFGLGGAQTFLLDLALGQKRTGRIQPIIYCLREKTPLGEYYQQLGLEIEYFEVQRNHPLEILSILPRVIWGVRTHQVDLVHTHLFVSSFFGRLAAWICRKPVVVHEQRNESEHIHWLTKSIERLLGRVTTAAICVSKTTRDFVVEIKDIDPRITWVIPNGIDTHRIKRTNTSEGCDVLIREISPENKPFIITTVGRLVIEKKFDIFLQATRGVLDKNKDVIFFILGDGPEMNRLKKIAVDLDLTENVHFLGASSDVLKYLTCSDIFVLTSDYEGLPLTILEAMALEVPVIVTEVDGNKEILEDGMGGILVPRRDPPSVTRAVLELLGDAAKRRTIGLNGRKIVVERYSIFEIQEEILKSTSQLLRLESI